MKCQNEVKLETLWGKVVSEHLQSVLKPYGLQKKKKKKMWVVLSVLCLPDMRPQHALKDVHCMTSMALDIPFHETPLIRDCYKHKGSCTLVSPYRGYQCFGLAAIFAGML